MEQAQIDSFDWKTEPQLTKTKFNHLFNFQLIKNNHIVNKEVLKEMERIIDEDYLNRNDPCPCHSVNGRRCEDASCIKRQETMQCPRDCKDGCENNVFRIDRWKHKLRLVHKEGRGFGIITNEAIRKDEFVIEYIGQVFFNEKNKYKNDSVYTAVIKSTNNSKDTQKHLVIEPLKMGGWARFTAHSCDPNMEIKTYCADEQLRNVLIAIKDIDPGTELTWNYGGRLSTLGIETCLCTKCVEERKTTNPSSPCAGVPVSHNNPESTPEPSCSTQQTGHNTGPSSMHLGRKTDSHSSNALGPSTPSNSSSSSNLPKAPKPSLPYSTQISGPSLSSVIPNATQQHQPPKFKHELTSASDSAQLPQASTKPQTRSRISNKVKSEQRRSKLVYKYKASNAGKTRVKRHLVIRPTQPAASSSNRTRRDKKKGKAVGTVVKLTLRSQANALEYKRGKRGKRWKRGKRGGGQGVASQPITKRRKGRPRVPRPKTHTCPTCGKEFEHKARWRYHLMEVHQEGDPLQCTECPKIFYSARMLKRHLESHRPKTRRRRFKCRTCSKEYVNKQHYHRHQNQEGNSCRVEEPLIVYPSPSPSPPTTN